MAPDARFAGPLAITHQRGPLNPRTWSGASAKLAQALREAGADVRGIHSGIRSPARKAFYALRSVVAGYGPLYTRARPARRYQAGVVRREALAMQCHAILHCGVADVPLRDPTFTIPQFSYTDTTWDMWHEDSRYRWLTNRLKRHADELERESYAQLEHIFAVSEFVRGRLIEHYGVPGERVTVVGTGRGSTIQPFMGDKDYESGPILFVAKHRFAEKGGPLLLEAFAIAQRQRPKLRLVMVGDDKTAARVGSIPNVEVRGHLPLPELQELFNRAALFAMPAWLEPWGMVYLEALACRTPILGLNRYAFPQISGHGTHGFIVERADPQLVADTLVDAVSDPQRLRRMGLAGQEFCLRHFTWDQVAAKIIDVMYADRSGTSGQ